MVLTSFVTLRLFDRNQCCYAESVNGKTTWTGRVQRVVDVLASTKLAAAIIAYAFALVLFGTLYQWSATLYEAQTHVFYAWLLTEFGLPLPGGAMLLVAFVINLCCSLVRTIPRVWRPAGLVVLHLGLMLLVAIGLSGVGTQFYTLGLWEGEVADRVFDPDRWEFVAHRGSETIARWDLAEIPERIDLTAAGAPEALERGAVYLHAGADAAPGGQVAFMPLDEPLLGRERLPLVELRNAGASHFIWAGEPSSALRAGPIELAVEPASIDLPFAVVLRDFSASFFPASEVPAAFTSQVQVQDGPSTFTAEIGMNEPLRYRGWVFYQSSYLAGPDRWASIFQVQRTRTSWAPYLAVGMIVLGGFWHYASRRLRSRAPRRPAAIVPVALLVFGLWTTATVDLAAQSVESGVSIQDVPASFERVLVLSGGRVMPIRTYARVVLESLSGRQSVDSDDAVAWMYALLTDPDRIALQEVVRVENPAVYPALGMAIRDRRRLSLADLAPYIDRIVAAGREIAPDDRDPLRRGVLSLAVKTDYLMRMATSGAAGLVADASPLYLEHELRIVAGDDGTWHHPADPDLQIDSLAAVAVRDALAAAAADPRSEAAWDRVAQAQLDQSAAPRSFALRAELIYEAFRPSRVAARLLALALTVLLLAPALGRLRERFQRYARVFGAGIAWSVAALLMVDIVLRVLITGRPPITSLPSSIGFVATALVIAVLTMTRSRPASRAAGLAAGLGLLFVSAGFGSGQDPIGVVQAILDTNFWLSVHVLTIASGYSFVLFAALVSAVYVVRRLHHGAPLPQQVPTYRLMMLLLRLALALTFLGTVLGGFWADQAWGRFWGWDPKENGALLLILWGAFALHARPARLVDDLGVALIGVWGLAIVAFSWFGVNMMAQGLHSYGWSDAGAYVMFVALGLVVLFNLVAIPVAIVQRRIRRRGERVTIESIAVSEAWFRVELGLSAELRVDPGSAIALEIHDSSRREIRAYSPVHTPTDGQSGTGKRLVLIGRLREEGFASQYFQHRARVGDVLGFWSGSRSLAGTRVAEQEYFLCRAEGVTPMLALLHDRIAKWDAGLLAPDYRAELHWAAYDAQLPVGPELAPLLEREWITIRHYPAGERIFLEELGAADWNQATAAYVCGGSAFCDDLRGQRDVVAPSIPWYEEAFVQGTTRNERSGTVQRVTYTDAHGRDHLLQVRPGQSLLEAMEAAGVVLRAGGCRVGQCTACLCTVRSGRVSLDTPNALPHQLAASGHILTCVAYPLDSTTIGPATLQTEPSDAYLAADRSGDAQTGTPKDRKR